MLVKLFYTSKKNCFLGRCRYIYLSLLRSILNWEGTILYIYHFPILMFPVQLRLGYSTNDSPWSRWKLCQSFKCLSWHFFVPPKDAEKHAVYHILSRCRIGSALFELFGQCNIYTHIQNIIYIYNIYIYSQTSIFINYMIFHDIKYKYIMQTRTPTSNIQV